MKRFEEETVITFGMYKGEKLKNLDLSYIKFLAGEEKHKSWLWVKKYHPEIVEYAKNYLKEGICNKCDCYFSEERLANFINNVE